MVDREKLILGTSDYNVGAHLAGGEFDVGVNVGDFQDSTDVIVGC